jgi:hypothetical protein
MADLARMKLSGNYPVNGIFSLRPNSKGSMKNTHYVKFLLFSLNMIWLCCRTCTFCNDAFFVKVKDNFIRLKIKWAITRNWEEWGGPFLSDRKVFWTYNTFFVNLQVYDFKDFIWYLKLLTPSFHSSCCQPLFLCSTLCGVPWTRDQDILGWQFRCLLQIE